MFVATYAPMSVGSDVTVQFRLPTGTLMASGTVCWVRAARPGRIAGMGIRFTEMGDGDRVTLRRFCGGRPRLRSYEEIVDATQ
jgi:Tfp pilus assembly protein PilZ